MIIEKIDWDKPYGRMIGEIQNGARYNQDGIDFDVNGNRVTPITEAELEAECVANEAAGKVSEAEAAKKAAVQKASTVLAASLAEDPLAPKEVKVDTSMPDFDSWSKTDLMNFARNKYPNIRITARVTKAELLAKLKSQYNAG